MKKTLKNSAILLILSVILMAGCRSNPEVKESDMKTPEELIQRGEYLVTIGGCHDCHSPKEMGPQGPAVISDLMLSGYPSSRIVSSAGPDIIKDGWVLFNPDLTQAIGPWGVSFAANLTSHQSGIGAWTEENFRRALTQGKYKGLEGSRMLLPPMPWFNFKTMTDEDVKAIYLYLMNTRPVNNVVPQPIGPDEPGK